MTLLSLEIDAAIAALEQSQAPTPEQCRELANVHLETLRQLRDFARDYEQGLRLNSRRVINLWGHSGAAARLYHWMREGRLRPVAGMGSTVVSLFRREQS